MPQKPDACLSYLAPGIEQLHKAIFIFDKNTKNFLYLNEACGQLLNVPKEDLNPHTMSSMVHPEDLQHLKQIWKELQRGSKVKDTEFRISTRTNTDNGKPKYKWIMASAATVMDIDSTATDTIIGIAEDITDWRDREANLERFAAKKDSVLEILSHDLAGPLNNIHGLSEILAKELVDHKRTDLADIVGLINQTSQRSVKLIRDFVNQEFLESKNASLIKERVDLVHRMQGIIEQYQNSENDISKTFKLISESRKIFVKIDAYKFSQVINNLISNSIKFTNDDGKITLTIVEKEENVLIELSDNGIGIPKKHHENLFDKFTSARRSGLKGEPSTGLGMSIIKTIVEWHDGKIWFDSEENAGSTFYIQLPKE